MTAPARSPWSAPIVLASIAIGTVILAASIVVGLVVIKPSHHRSNNDTPPPTTTVTQTTTDSSTTTTTTTTRSRPPGAASFRQPSVPNTDPHGFTDGGPRCQVSADPVMMVVVTDRSQAIICQSAATGREYYVGQSDVSDGTPVTVQSAGRQDAGWVATAPDGTEYLMSPNGFVVVSRGQSYPDTVQDYWSQ